MSNQLSNVLGVAIPYDLKRQLDVRSQKLGAEKRTSSDIQYLANRNCWVRLVSSVRIKDLEYFRKYFPDLDLKDHDSLAKKFILFAGTSEYAKNQQSTSGFQYNLRSGFGQNGSYGMLGNAETQLYGYKPMPGITDARIETQGKLGSIRSATINFKVWDKAQLDIVDALYFKLGYTMFLEWGHTTYFDNGDGLDFASPKLQRSDLKQIDPFPEKESLKKEIVLREISSRIDECNGNYDAMLGMCTNFNFSMNEDGGYDCSIKMIALGELASQIKINQAGTLPGILNAEIKQLVNIYNKILRDKARQAQNDAQNSNLNNNTPTPNNSPSTAILIGDSLTYSLHANTKNIQPIGEDGRYTSFSRWGVGWSTKDLLERINTMTIDTSITRVFISIGTNGLFTDLPSAPISKLVTVIKQKYPIAQIYVVQGSYGWGTNKDGAIYGGVRVSNIQDKIKQYYDIWKANGVTVVDNPPIYATAHPDGNTPGIKTAGGAIEKIISTQPVVVDQAVLQKANQSADDAAIAAEFYKAIEGIFTDETGVKNALKRIKDGAQYVRVRDIVKKTGTSGRSIVDWINKRYNSGTSDTASIENLVIVLNNMFKQKFASAEYTSYTNNNASTPTTTFSFKEDSFKVDNDALYAALAANEAAAKAKAATPPAAPTTPTPDPIPEITVETVQTEEQLQYQSGLEVFLRAIQLHSFNLAYSDASIGKISTINLFDKKQKFITELFNYGVLSKSAVEFATDKQIQQLN